MTHPRAQNTKEALAAFDYREPLPSDDPRYVDLWPARSDDSPATKIDQELPTPSGRFLRGLVLGHQGTGKSSELGEIVQRLGTEFYVTLVDSSDFLGPRDLAIEDLMIFLAQSILRAAHDHDFDLSTVKSEIEVLQTFGREIVHIETEESGTDVALESEGTSGLIGRALGILTKATARMSQSDTRRQEVRQTVGPRLSSLLGALQRVSQAAFDQASRSKRGLLLLVDGLNHMPLEIPAGSEPTSYENLLMLNARRIRRLHCHLVIVAPIGLAVQGEHARQYGWEVLHVPNVQVRDRSGNEVPKGITTMMQVVEKRAEPTVFAAGAVRLAARLSGGNVRDLLIIVREGARAAKTGKITKKHVIHAASSYGSDLWARTENDDDRDALVDLKALTRDVTADGRVQRLLRMGCLLSYRNAEHWAAVHPCIVRLKGWDVPGAEP